MVEEENPAVMAAVVEENPAVMAAVEEEAAAEVRLLASKQTPSLSSEFSNKLPCTRQHAANADSTKQHANAITRHNTKHQHVYN